MTDVIVREPDVSLLDRGFHRGLSLFDSTMIVAGSMIGSGILIVPAAMARELGSPGWLLVSWLVAGALSLSAALSYGEWAMMPRAGGQYIYLREGYSPLCAFLYGWTLFTGDSDGDHCGDRRRVRAVHRNSDPLDFRGPLPRSAAARVDRLCGVAVDGADDRHRDDRAPTLPHVYSQLRTDSRVL